VSTTALLLKTFSVTLGVRAEQNPYSAELAAMAYVLNLPPALVGIQRMLIQFPFLLSLLISLYIWSTCPWPDCCRGRAGQNCDPRGRSPPNTSSESEVNNPEYCTVTHSHWHIHSVLPCQSGVEPARLLLSTISDHIAVGCVFLEVLRPLGPELRPKRTLSSKHEFRE
jgi:hypothetical protein